MKNKNLFIKASCILVCIAVILIIHSCRKDIKTNYQDVTDPEVQQAMEWYNQANPIHDQPIKNNQQSIMSVAAGANPVDLSQYIGPDWHHASKYTRFNKNVIEMPIDPAHKLQSAFQNSTTGRTGQAKYSKSSFLILRNGNSYSAYIMTIIADSAYLKNDLSKLNRNTYSHRDTNFSGTVLYFTPKGQYLSGYKYINGNLVTVPSITNNTTVKTQSSVDDDGGTYTCTDWFLVNYIDGEPVSATFLYRTCVYNGDGNSNNPTLPGGGGGGGDQGCPTGYTPASIKVNTLDGPHDGLDDNPDPGFPEPAAPHVCVKINVKNGCSDPCLRRLVDAALDDEGDDGENQVAVLIQGTFGATVKCNLTVVQVGSLPDNEDAVTVSPVPTGGQYVGSGIGLNGNILPNASEEYVFVTILHEALHAYMDSQGIDINQHDEIATLYVNNMASTLMSVFGMSRDDAYGLSWGGLEKSSAYINYITDPTDPKFKDQAYLPNGQAQINAHYRYPNKPGGKGKACN